MAQGACQVFDGSPGTEGAPVFPSPLKGREPVPETGVSVHDVVQRYGAELVVPAQKERVPAAAEYVQL